MDGEEEAQEELSLETLVLWGMGTEGERKGERTESPREELQTCLSERLGKVQDGLKELRDK